MTYAPGVLTARRQTTATPALSSLSLRFPQANGGGDASAYSTITATGVTAAGPLFAAEGALVALIEVPWREFAGTGDRLVHILSNHAGATATAAGEFSITAFNPAGEVNAPSVTVSAHNGTTVVAATCTLPDRWTERMLVVARVDGAGEMALACYADGAAVGTVAYAAGEQTLAGLTLKHHGFLLGAPCDGGSLTPATVGGRTGFPGSIGFVGYHVGAVSEAAALALSAGARFDVALSPGAWRFARVLAARTGPVPAAIWASGDTLPAWTRTTSSLWRHGSDLVPARDGSGNWLALDTIRDGTVWGVPPGATEVAVPLSVTSSGLTGGIEVRALYATGAVHTDWIAVPDLDLTGGGAASGARVLSLFTGGWGALEIRSAANPDLVFRSRALCGVGYVASLIGQSNVGYPISPDLQTGEAVSVSAYGNISCALMYHPVAGVSFVVGRVTAENTVDGGFFLAAAEEIARYGTTPVMLFDMTMSGTGIQEYLQNGTGREWDEEVTVLAAITSGLVSLHMLGWETAAGYSWYSIGEAQGNERIDALVFGTAAGSTAAWTIDHHLLDGELSDTAAVCFAPFMSDNNGDSVATDHAMQTADFYATRPNGSKSFKDWNRLYAAANPAEGWWAEPAPSFDSYTDGSHVVERLYNARAGRRWVQTLMRATGHDTTTNPRILDVSCNPAGDTITVTVNLPNGGNLQTRWGFEGTTVPEGENPVQGFEIANFADANASRLGFTAAITDTGTGTAPNRTGTVTITMDEPLDPGAILYYVPARVLAYGEAAMAKELIDGLLYESGPAEGGMGILVENRVIKPARPVIPATDIPHTKAYFAVGSAVMYQERATTSGGTLAAVGQPVGTAIPEGSAGGYFTALTDELRPILRRDPITGASYLEVIGGRGLTYHNGAGTASPLLPNTNTFHFGAAIEHLQVTTEAAVFTQFADSQTGRWLMRQNQTANAGWWTFFWNGVSNAFRTGGTVPRELVSPLGQQQILQLNIANGSEASALHFPVGTQDTFTVASSGVHQGSPFRIGLTTDWGSVAGSFKLYGLIVSDDTLTADELALARTWLMSAAGNGYPHK